MIRSKLAIIILVVAIVTTAILRIAGMAGKRTSLTMKEFHTFPQQDTKAIILALAMDFTQWRQVICNSIGFAAQNSALCLAQMMD